MKRPVQTAHNRTHRAGNATHGSGVDPRMCESCFVMPPRDNPIVPGPRRSHEDDKDKAKFIDEYLKQKGWAH